MLRSFSGPSGKVVGSKFVLDETRNRFVFPQDHTIVVYFEWEAAPGEHTMTATWKNPDGRVAYISPDVRLVSETTALAGYWNYEIYATTPAGIWTLDVRVDGQPAGTHSFEVVMPAQAPIFSVEQIYNTALRSLVWVHKIDSAGRRFDTSSGFVIAKDRIATAFQAIDAAGLLEIEFADGRTVKTAGIWSLNRLEDWAVVQADTQALPALAVEIPKESFVGQRLIVFLAENNLRRTIGGVDITGRNSDPVFGERIHFDPGLSLESSGGPLITQGGQVVAIIGGSQSPGSRYEQRALDSFSVGAYRIGPDSSATPVNPGLMESPAAPTNLAALAAQGRLTNRLVSNRNLLFASTATQAAKNFADISVTSQARFSRQDTIWVHSQWTKREKNGKGAIGARVYDVHNRVLLDVPAKKASLNSNETIHSFNFQPKNLPRGSYRIDLLWDNQPVWRTFVSIVD